MNCAEFIERRASYLYQLLPAAEMAAAAAHAGSCASCAAPLQELKVLLCKQVIEFLGDYLEQVLPERERKSLELHLSLCPECIDYLKGYEAAIRLTRDAYDDHALPVPELPEELVRAVLAAQAAAKRRDAPPRP